MRFIVALKQRFASFKLQVLEAQKCLQENASSLKKAVP